MKITFGDNDILAALVAQALRANLLVLLTVVDGLLDGDAQPVRLVPDIEQARQLVRKEKSALGKGGMDSKLEAARMVTGAGDAMIVADGRMPEVLPRLLDGEVLGTLFVPSPKKRPSRSRWIGSVRPIGAIIVDDGAVKALVEKNRSLLPRRHPPRRRPLLRRRLRRDQVPRRHDHRPRVEQLRRRGHRSHPWQEDG